MTEGIMQQYETAIFAGGCFWGVQFYFDQVPGVIETEVGYTGGTVPHPTYELVCSHTTGHAEATRIVFDPTVVTYITLLRHFFRLHDPTQLNRQGVDIGDSYRSAIFYTNEAQREEAEKMVVELSEQKIFQDPIVTQIVAAGEFYAAEDYHQKYTEKTGRGFCHVAYAPIA
jgi:peptide methionine sulfoxide reductase msrA/msrB